MHKDKKHIICIRLSPEDFEYVNALVEQAGMSKQRFFELLIDNATLPTVEDTQALVAIEKQIAELNAQLRGATTNINQMAKVANATGITPEPEHFIDLEITVGELQREVLTIWQYLKPLIQARLAGRH